MADAQRVRGVFGAVVEWVVSAAVAHKQLAVSLEPDIQPVQRDPV